MRTVPASLHLTLALSVLLLQAACATSRGHAPHGDILAPHLPTSTSPHAADSESAPWPALDSSTHSGARFVDQAPSPQVSPDLRTHALPDGRWRLFLPPLPPNPKLEVLSLAEVRPFLAAFHSLGPEPRARLHLLESPETDRAGQGHASSWERRMREEFISQFGPPLLPLPESLATSRLFLALQLSTRYMAEGIREAALELFTSPAFVLSVCFSIIVYFSAWLAPEPLFSKAFAAALTVRLSLAVGVVEVGQLALACLRLYEESEAASTPQQLEAASARFGKSMGGTWLRVLVTVGTLGVARFIPQVPEGGIWRLLPSLTPEGLTLARSISTVQVVADGSLLVSGVAAGIATCSGLALCATNSSGSASSGTQQLSTRYGKPHTRQNPPHNEAIEKELAAREAAGHGGLRKNQPQVNERDRRVFDTKPAKGVRFRKPDVSSLRPDGVRHNINYVSNPRDMKRELDAFDSMIRADSAAIHELYLLNGKLLKRYVPPHVKYP